MRRLPANLKKFFQRFDVGHLRIYVHTDLYMLFEENLHLLDTYLVYIGKRKNINHMARTFSLKHLILPVIHSVKLNRELATQLPTILI